MMLAKRVLGIAALVGGGFALRRWLSSREVMKEDSFPMVERRARPDPESLTRQTNGGRPAMDVEKLASVESSQYKPVVEYLKYIQVQRGEESSLVFVRERDLDALAEMTGGSRETFVEEFKQLGVLVSMN